MPAKKGVSNNLISEEKYLQYKLFAKRSIEDRGYLTPCWIWTDQKLIEDMAI